MEKEDILRAECCLLIYSCRRRWGRLSLRGQLREVMVSSSKFPIHPNISLIDISRSSLPFTPPRNPTKS